MTNTDEELVTINQSFTANGCITEVPLFRALYGSVNATGGELVLVAVGELENLDFAVVKEYVAIILSV